MTTAKKLTDHFTLQELTNSQTAKVRGISNVPTPQVEKNLTDLAKKILEPLRVAIGQPLRISSGYRSPQLNKAIGGVTTSAHCFGLAADITVPGFMNGDVKKLCEFTKDFLDKNKIAYDQIIFEHLGSQWMHIGLRHPDGRQRRQAITINRKGTFSGFVN